MVYRLTPTDCSNNTPIDTYILNEQSRSQSPRVFWLAPKDTWALERDC